MKYIIFFLNPGDEIEMKNIFLDSLKAIGLKSTPTKILKLLTNFHLDLTFFFSMVGSP